VSSPPHFRTETDPVSETCVLVLRIPDGGQSPETSNSECLSVITKSEITEYHSFTIP
jgi:hypothetical protein